MSATDELRRMLDEAGVEWDYGITGAASTMFNANGVELTFIGMRDGVTCSTILTPVQAIEATLGRSECRFRTVERFIDARRSRADMCECDRCGYRCARGFIQDEPVYEQLRELGIEVPDA